MLLEERVDRDRLEAGVKRLEDARRAAYCATILYPTAYCAVKDRSSDQSEQFRHAPEKPPAFKRVERSAGRYDA